jgi:hypothetical protein
MHGVLNLPIRDYITTSLLLQLVASSSTRQRHCVSSLLVRSKYCTFSLECFIPSNVFLFIRDSSVGIATGYGLDDRGGGIRVPVGTRILSFPRRPQRHSGPPNLLTNGYQVLFPGGKRSGREADHSPPTSAEVKKIWIYTSTPPYALLA